MEMLGEPNPFGGRGRYKPMKQRYAPYVRCKSLPPINKEYMKEEKEIIKFTSRFKKEIYDKAKKMASVRGMSINQFLMLLVYQSNE